MDSKTILYCSCGWDGFPHIKHSYELPHANAAEDRILHTESYHCKKCGVEIQSSQNLIYNSDLSPKDKHDLGIKQMSLPYEFSTQKFELEIFEDNFTIYSRDITDTTRIKHIFRSKNSVACIGEIFYDAVLHPIIPGDSFSAEYRVTDSEIDAFCEYFLEHFTVSARKPKFPQIPLPNIPSVPNFFPQSNPGRPLPWYDPNKVPYPSPTKKINPYADAKILDGLEDFLDDFAKDLNSKKNKI